MMIDEQVRAGLSRRLVLLYFYVLYSHQTHSHIHTHLSHPPLTGLVGRHKYCTPHNTTPHLYAEKYRLHRRGRLYIEQAADMGLGRFFLSFEDHAYRQNVFWNKYKTAAHFCPPD